MALRVAVLGASGFGRYHAKWYAHLGCQVVAFLGSSPRSVARTASALKEAFGLDGRGYCDLDELLSAEKPDAVSVCTPPPLHAAMARKALEAGCSVLCEKPFVWDPRAEAQGLLAEARAIVEAARARGVALAVDTQYAAAAELYRELAPPEALRGLRRFTAEMTSLLRPGGPRGRDILVDLLPHPLSVLVALLAEAEVVEGSVEVGLGRKGGEVRFEVEWSEGRRCGVGIRVAKLPRGPFPRRFGFDGVVADCEARPDEQGVYRGHVRIGGRDLECEDFMKTSIARFCRAAAGEGEPLVGARAALRNLEMMLAVLAAATPGN